MSHMLSIAKKELKAYLTQLEEAKKRDHNGVESQLMTP